MSYVPLEQLPPAKQRSALIYIARVHLREAIARRGDRSFSHILLRWAGNARRRATAIDLRPQGDLFGRRA